MSQSRLNLLPHLKVLYGVFEFFKLTSFEYNYSIRRMEPVAWRSRLSRGIFHILLFGSLYTFGFLLVAFSFHRYYLNKKNVWRSVQAQDNVLVQLIHFSEAVGVFIIGRNYLKHSHAVMQFINEMFQIHEHLAWRSDATIFFPSSFQVALAWKIILTVVAAIARLPLAFDMLILNMDVVGFCCEILIPLTYLAHLYAQLVMICFYTKMNDILAIASAQVDRVDNRVFKRGMRELLGILFRIHRVKRKLNILFSPLMLASYLGLFGDIHRFYGLLRVLIFRRFSPNPSSWIQEFLMCVQWDAVLFVASSYDIYLIGLLSNMLVQCQAIFELRLLVLTCRNEFLRLGHVDKEVEQSVVRSCVYDLNSRNVQVVKMNLGFAFEYFANVVFVYVIVCLQFYASEVIVVNVDVQRTSKVLIRL